MSQQKGDGSGPPALVRFLLRVLLPADEREFYMGDLEESGRRPWFREILGAVALRLSPYPSVGSDGRLRFMIAQIAADVRLGLRRLLRSPASTLTAFTALSVGIGLSALMFSLISGTLLVRMPFDAGERMYRVNREDFSAITVEAFEYWRAGQRSFEGLAAWTDRVVNLAIEGGGNEPVWSAALDVSVLRLLSEQPVLGRVFTEADAVLGAPPVVLLSHATWRTRMSADPGVLGRTVRVNGEPAEIIGVMPEDFGFPMAHDLWLPLQLDALRQAGNGESLSLFGVLRAGVSTRVAAAELNELDRQRPRPAREPEAAPIEVRAFTDIVNPRGRTQLLAGVMLAVALLVLLVACANATNVLLAQGAVRGREVAVRTALGASRARIAAQFWAEVSLLALAGAVGGVALAEVGLRLVRNAVPTTAMPFWFDLRIDLPVLGFVVAAAVLAAMLAGVAPAFHASRANRHELLKDTSRGTSSRRLGRVMGRLIGVEMAVSFMLLVAAGLFVRSAVNLQRYDFPFDPAGVYTTHIRLPDGGYESGSERAALVARLEERLSAIPGASSAIVTTEVPGIAAARRNVAVQGLHDAADSDLPNTRYIAVSPRFFEMFGATTVTGRAFDARDQHGEFAVAIVNRAFQDAYLPAGAVGHRLMLGHAGTSDHAFPSGDSENEWLTIVGVVPDLMAGGIERELEEAVYRPLAQDAPTGFQVAVRSTTAAHTLAAPIRDAIAEVDPDLALSFQSALDESINAANAAWAWLSALFLVAGGLALFLAAIGLYGVMAFWVAQRTREIGVRMALGGRRLTIVAFVLHQAMSQVALGLIAGALLAAPVAWLLRGILLDVRPFDPLVFGAVVGVLLSAGSLGCMLPALRATRVDPQVALAAE